jgi:pimeloyl-ACP methyl ester carboxylesterase
MSALAEAVAGAVPTIRDYPASSRPTWWLVLQEAAAFVAAGLLMPFGLRTAARRTPRRREQRTVVLVHGYLANRSTFFPLAAYLRLQGVSVLSFDYDSTAGIERGAIALRDFLRRHVRGGRIDLVCHSLGGLVARVYLQELGGDRRVDRCITLGTPHGGTYNSYWLWSRVGGELRPDSRLLARLRASGPATRVRFVSLIAGADNLVIPRVFAKHEQEVLVADVGHLSMLFSPTVLAAVASQLRPALI